MKTYIKSMGVLITGMVAFQIISTLQVYISNLNLYSLTVIIKNAGYFTIPNAVVMESLKSIKPAFCGAVFFTLSIGTMVTLFSFLAAHLYHSFHRKKLIIAGFSIIIFCLLFVINSRGICFIETASFIIIPSIIFILFSILLKKDCRAIDLKKICIHAIPVIVLACILVLSSGTANSKIFSDFRDNFLISNNAGMKINDFYYNYTLYPARVFKSLKKKILKTAYIDTVNKTDRYLTILESRLISNDYLVITDKSHADLVVHISDNMLSLSHKNKAVMKISKKGFLYEMRNVLEEFSDKTDTYFFYRKITGLSLITGLPLFMYIMMHFIFFIIFSRIPFSHIRFIHIRKSDFPPIIASACCFTIGLSGFAVLTLMKPRIVTPDNLDMMLHSKIMQDRVEGLKFISENNLEMSISAIDNEAIKSPYVLERYWFARAAGSDRSINTYDKLIQLLDDPHPNVVCQAFYGLGEKRNRKAIPEIIQRIQRSKNWYAQWYAYRALKRLGWTQKKLK